MLRERGHTSYLMDHQVRPLTFLNLGQVLAATILNAVPTLAYEEVTSSAKTYQVRPCQQLRQVGTW